MAICIFSNSTVTNVYMISSMLGFLSLVMCVAAIATLIYYKLYHSFNYRLILYLLISFLIDAITKSLHGFLQTIHTELTISLGFCKAFIFLVLYSIWNTHLSIAFMVAQVFSMIVFSIELRKVEVPLTLACFILPTVMAILPLIPRVDHLSGCDSVLDDNSTTHFLQYNAISGMAITGICVVAIATAMSCLAYRSLQWHFIDRNNEGQYLLRDHTRKRYQNALKESLPLAVYPIIVSFLLLMIYLYLIECNTEVMYIFVFTSTSIGSISSIIFFAHVKILGQHRRNKFKKKSHFTVPSNTVQQINEEQRFTAAGSITGTHITDFDPLGESDIES